VTRYSLLIHGPSRPDTHPLAPRKHFAGGALTQCSQGHASDCSLPITRSRINHHMAPTACGSRPYTSRTSLGRLGENKSSSRLQCGTLISSKVCVAVQRNDQCSRTALDSRPAGPCVPGSAAEPRRARDHADHTHASSLLTLTPSDGRLQRCPSRHRHTVPATFLLQTFEDEDVAHDGSQRMI